MSTSSSDRAHETAEARTAFVASLTSVGTNLDADMRARAATLHENNASLAKQEDDLKKTTQSLAKQTTELEKMAEQASQSLKEVGDLQNFAEMMERDLLILEETLDLAEEEDRKQGRVDKPQSKLRRWF
jgi:DNA anti-recombination protein RmuC